MAAVGTQLRSSSNNGGVSRLSMMQAKFREQLMLEKESRLLEMAARQEAERENTIHRVTKTPGNSLSSSMSSLNTSGAGQGRVRKMFEERRNNSRGYYQSPKGYDKSYPLEPVKRDGGRPPARGGRSGRGISVDRLDRGLENRDEPHIGQRSKSQVAPQRANRGDSRFRRALKSPDARGVIETQHKSASSMMEGNNGSPRRPSPAPPSSTKSSPGPRVRPVTPPKRNAKVQPPTSRHKATGFLGVNANNNSDNRNRSPTPTHEDNKYEYYDEREEHREASGEKGFFAKFGLRSSKNTTKETPIPRTGLPPKMKATGDIPLGTSTPKPSPTMAPLPDNFRRCNICERSFASDRIEKHQTICRKAQQKAKKRKIFDPVKMRTQGTEAEKFVAKGDHLKINKRPVKKNDWRKKHEDFIKTVRAAKGMAGYEAPPIDTSDYVKCPHCGRKFSESVADRHIPKCKDITSNKPRNKDPPPPKAPPRRRR